MTMASRTGTPSAEDLRLAAEWLRQYDDEHDGGADTKRCTAVAEWLEGKANALDECAAAREVGVPVGRLRAVMARKAKEAGVPVSELRAGMVEKQTGEPG